MELIVSPTGQIRCIYGESLDLVSLGQLSIQRASYVEPDRAGQWWTDLRPVGGPFIGPFSFRSLALEFEAAWLQEHWLNPASET